MLPTKRTSRVVIGAGALRDVRLDFPSGPITVYYPNDFPVEPALLPDRQQKLRDQIMMRTADYSGGRMATDWLIHETGLEVTRDNAPEIERRINKALRALKGEEK